VIRPSEAGEIDQSLNPSVGKWAGQQVESSHFIQTAGENSEVMRHVISCVNSELSSLALNISQVCHGATGRLLFHGIFLPRAETE
jgi:hypothetical protein